MPAEADVISKEQIRLLIVDDHAVLRSGLRLLLEAQPDMVVVGEAESAEQAINRSVELQPDMVLMDLALPLRPGDPNRVASGLQAIERIRAERPESRVLVLTMHEDEDYLRAVLASGGAGYVLKRAADTELLSAIRAVSEGGTFLHRQHIPVLLEQAQPTSESQESTDDSYERLSPRERQVLRLIALGHTNQEVADMLYLSVKTIETYKARLMTKLELTGRAALVRYALERGLLNSSE